MKRYELVRLPTVIRENYDKGSNTQGYKEGFNQCLDNIKHLNSDEITVERIAEIVTLKLNQMLVEDKPDEKGYTKGMIIAEAILKELKGG